MATWIQTVTAKVPGIGLIAAEQYAVLIGALVLLVMVALMM